MMISFGLEGKSVGSGFDNLIFLEVPDSTLPLPDT
jgi:hypothetical protein